FCLVRNRALFAKVLILAAGPAGRNVWSGLSPAQLRFTWPRAKAMSAAQFYMSSPIGYCTGLPPSARNSFRQSWRRWLYGTGKPVMATAELRQLCSSGKSPVWKWTSSIWGGYFVNDFKLQVRALFHLHFPL